MIDRRRYGGVSSARPSRSRRAPACRNRALRPPRPSARRPEEPKLSSETPAAAPTPLRTPRPATPSQKSRPLPPPPPGTGATGRPTGLDRLNAASPEAAEAVLLDCCGSRRWARRLAAHRPYPDPDALLAAADEASYDLTPGDLDEALARETVSPRPLVGARGPGTLAAHTALRAAHAEYERQFRHAFVICLDGYRDTELLNVVLSGIHDRLGNEPEEERAIAADELRRLARGRLARRAA
ncbi:2-oxo-4-hydroxy-4-carboxy-5-ureidoimidazoline decarboxylase [Streptomyces sp. NPDC017056]|uniref:2-oxo-4-hydroxy-4-carboxy-5-ureidoimidazoline decarboxylase n=1 Tax=Streptomyces sp. NPDC017056 TaxID=3364973 RepID=UPI0037AEB700